MVETLKSQFTATGVRRAGDDYQDMIALDLLVQWLEHPDRYRSVLVEADDSGFLDDVVAQNADGSMIALQVKFSAHPEVDDDAWGWDALLSEHEGAQRRDGSKKMLPSLLAKWLNSVDVLRPQATSVDAIVTSNRRAAPDLAAALLPSGHVDLARIGDAGVRAELSRQIGGDDRARDLLAHLRFDLDRPALDVLEDGVRRRFHHLGGDEAGWHSLKNELRRWVRHRHEPFPDGAIHLANVRRAAKWYELQPLPQRFAIPSDYVLPSEEFHQELVGSIKRLSSGCLVLTASPGMGKSTYCSYMYDELKKNKVPVVRHHYFLSTSDRNPHRLDHRPAAESLMHDLARDHSDALHELAAKNPHAEDLPTWVEACGEHYSRRGESLVIIVDGLDHVWRERSSIEELRKLLEFLLPAPRGVVVLVATQPVVDEQLPRVLLRGAPRDSWRHLRRLDPHAVRQWVEHHRDEIGNLADDDVPDFALGRVAAEFYRKSNGHPLHLRYSLKALQEGGTPVTEDNIRTLPDCPHGDITEYYRELLTGLEDESRLCIYLIAAAGFSWPRAGILDCLPRLGVNRARADGALRRVEHLLVPDDLGLRAFHGSILVFVTGLSEWEDHARALRLAILQWVKEDAPEHWRWAYEWMLEADLGNERPLIDGPSRMWTVSALAERRTPKDVSDILGRSSWLSLKPSTLPRVIDAGLLREYFEIPYEYYRQVPEALLFAQLRTSTDRMLRRRLLAGLDTLTDQEIFLLAEAEAEVGNDTTVGRCLHELIERNNTGRQRATDGQYTPWQTKVAPLLQVAALAGPQHAVKTADFAVRNRAVGEAITILSLFTDQLLRNRDAAGLRRLLDLEEEPTSQESPDDADPLKGSPSSEEPSRPGLSPRLTRSERQVVLRAMILLAIEENLDVRDIVCGPIGASDPLAAIYSALRPAPAFNFVPRPFPPNAVPELKRHELYQRRSETQALFHDLFFQFLANHLHRAGTHNSAWLNSLNSTTWQIHFLNGLNEIASGLADAFLAGSSPPFGWFYTQLRALTLPRGEYDRDEPAFEYSRAARKAALTIGFDIFRLCVGVGDKPRISYVDLEGAFSSGYCDPEEWIQLYASHRRQWLDDEGVHWLVREQGRDLSTSVQEFYRRAERYAGLACVASLHTRWTEAQGLVTATAENLLTHGNHKDVLLYQVLEVVQVQSRERLGRVDNPTPSVNASASTPRAYLLRIGHVIAHVLEFTDGDETGHLPRQLADVLGEVAPDLLLNYYPWLCQTQQFESALHAFRVLVRTADLSDPLNAAIAKTAADRGAQRILHDRSVAGDPGATEVIGFLSAYFGPATLGSKSDDAEATSADQPAELLQVIPEEYPPHLLGDFLKAVRTTRGIGRDEHLKRWITFWHGQGQGAEVLAAIETAYGRERLWGSADLILDIAFALHGRAAAYPWLIRAHREELGWSRYFSLAKRETVKRRWEYVRTYYPERWLEFIRDTLQPEGSSPWRDFVIGSSAWVRIVEYLVFVGQEHLANDLVERMISGALAMVSPLQLPTPEWVQVSTDDAATGVL